MVLATSASVLGQLERGMTLLLEAARLFGYSGDRAAVLRVLRGAYQRSSDADTSIRLAEALWVGSLNDWLAAHGYRLAPLEVAEGRIALRKERASVA